MNDEHAVREMVRQGYGAIAAKESSCCATSCCGGTDSDNATALATAIGYAPEELTGLPEGANLGLSCGNPTALAQLKAGEVVLDLGSGAGFDVFIAGKKVGATGLAIGVDMTPQMLAKARGNMEAYRQRSGLDNVEFRLGEIEYLPVPDNSVDVIISNCVINLSPNKPQVWREMARVLKPGGRVAVSDIALVQPLPAQVLQMVEAIVGCIAGAVLVEDTEAMAREAGFTDIHLEKNSAAVDAMLDNVQDELFAQVLQHMPRNAKAGDYVVSLAVSAIKPH